MQIALMNPTLLMAPFFSALFAAQLRLPDSRLIKFCVAILTGGATINMGQLAWLYSNIEIPQIVLGAVIIPTFSIYLMTTMGLFATVFVCQILFSSIEKSQPIPQHANLVFATILVSGLVIFLFSVLLLSYITTTGEGQ